MDYSAGQAFRPEIFVRIEQIVSPAVADSVLRVSPPKQQFVTMSSATELSVF
jgi:hypothetical protein